MSSTDNSTDVLNSFSNSINDTIIDRFSANTMTKEDAMILPNMFTRIQTDSELFKVIRNFNTSFSKSMLIGLKLILQLQIIV